jgi:hypothetical protein
VLCADYLLWTATLSIPNRTEAALSRSLPPRVGKCRHLTRIQFGAKLLPPSQTNCGWSPGQELSFRYKAWLSDTVEKRLKTSTTLTEQLRALGREVARGSCQFALEPPTKGDAAKAEAQISPVSDREARSA